MAIPSIAMIPSGYKANKLYSVLPTNGDGDFTTTRNTVGTRVNENGLIEEVASNVPRLDYSDGTCPSLLLEPASTNLIPYSEDFSNAAWVKTRCTILANQSISPDGTLNATLMTATDDDARLEDVVGVLATATTQSIYIKSATGNNVAGVIDFAGTDIVAFTANNEWQRIESTLTNLAISSRVRARIINSGDAIYIYGAQLEEQSYATSYIKNEGTAAGITRAADTATGSGNSTVINSTEGVLYFEGSVSVNDANKQIRIANSSVSLNSITLEFRDNGTTLRTYIFDGDATNQFLSNTTIDPNIYNKICLKYKENDCALYLNGVEVASDLLGTMPSGLDLLNFDNTVGGTPFYGKTKSVQVYTTALSDIEIEKLTSYTSFTAMANALKYTII